MPLRIVDDGATSNDTRRGALGDLALALGDSPPGDVLVLAGDNLIDFDLAPYAERLGEHPIVFARTIDGIVPPSRYSEIEVDGAGRVTSFREKPAEPRSNLSAPALYLFPADVTDDLRTYLDAGNDPDAPGHFLAWLHGRRVLEACPLPLGWYDIGDLETLERARAAYDSRGETNA
jgi:glucose-1-phosphate thymidylyltransferase